MSNPRVCAVALLALAAANAGAAGTTGAASITVNPAPAAASDAGAERAMLARLKKLYPSTPFSSVALTPLPGVFEVVMGPNVAYVGADGRHFLFGHMFDLQRQVDVTALRQRGAEAAARTQTSAQDMPQRGVKLDELPLQDAIVQVNGSGERRLVVFSDPKCAHCSTLDADLRELADTTVYTFLVPMLGHDSREAARKQWALSMPERALEVAVLDQNIELARRLGIQATPTLIRSDGEVRSGAVSLPELAAWLAAGTKVLQAAQR